MKEEAEEVSVDTRYRESQRERERKRGQTHFPFLPRDAATACSPPNSTDQLSCCSSSIHTRERAGKLTLENMYPVRGKERERKREEGRREVAVGEVNERAQRVMNEEGRGSEGIDATAFRSEQTFRVEQEELALLEKREKAKSVNDVEGERRVCRMGLQETR